MSSPITTFRHVRARVHRTGVDVWLAAWVVHLASDGSRLRLQTFVSLQPDERLEVECYGDGSMVRFSGVVLSQAGQTFAMSITGPMTFESSPEEVRLCVTGVEGEVWDGGEQASVIVMDVSPESLGGLADRAFSLGDSVGVSLRTPLGPYEAETVVANCRADPTQEGYFRLGLRIMEASRLDAALWKRLLRECAAA